MEKELLRVASVLDRSGQFELSDKLFTIAQQLSQQQIPNFQNTLGKAITAPYGIVPQLVTNKPLRNFVVQKAQQGLQVSGEPALQFGEAKDRAEIALHGAKKATEVTKLGQMITQNLPNLVKGLKAAEELMEKVNSSPAGKVASGVLLALNAKVLIEEGLELLHEFQEKGVAEVWNTDAKKVIKVFANLVSLVTNPQVTAFLVPLVPIQPVLTNISIAANLYSGAVDVVDAGTTAYYTTNTALQNNEGTYAKSSVMPLDQLADQYGEVYNTLIDYVNGRGTISQLIAKNLPDNNPQKMALVNAHIAQKVLPSKNAQYVKSSYWKARHRAKQPVQHEFGDMSR